MEGRCERISEREEEESMSDSETEDNDGDYNDDEEEEDSVFEEVGESEEQKEKNCPMTGMRWKKISFVKYLIILEYWLDLSSLTR